MLKGKDFVMIDIETSGLDEKKDKIVFYRSMVMPYSGETYFREGYGNPGFEIDPYITKLTKITNDDVKYAISSEMLKEEIVDLIKDKIVIASNKRFLEAFLGEKIEPCLDIKSYNLAELKKQKYYEEVKDLERKFSDKKELKISDVQAELRCDYNTAELLYDLLIERRNNVNIDKTK